MLLTKKKKNWDKQQIVVSVVLLKSVSYLNEEKEDHQFVTDCISFHELEWISVTVV